MAANVAIDDAGAEALALQPPRRKRMSGKKLVLFVVLPLLLVGGGVGGAIATGLVPLGGGVEHAEEQPAQVDPTKLVFYDMPEMLVNLNTTGKRPSFLKMRVSLELGDAADQAHIQKLAPRLIDSFQVYLRELRADDLRGSAGISRLKEELLRRVNATVAPVHVRDVLFREMLVQ